MSATPARDPFVGAWTLNISASAFDPNHRPRAGRMRIEFDADGWIVMTAEGVTEKGEPCVERPNRLNPDGNVYPVPDFAGLAVRRDPGRCRDLQHIGRRAFADCDDAGLGFAASRLQADDAVGAAVSGCQRISVQR